MRLNSHSQRIQVCRLSTASQNSICDHFQRLNLPSRRARFCGAISDGEVLKYAQNIFSHNAIVCGGFVDGQLRGVVELRGLFQSWPSTAEAAFSVEPDWQNTGIGDALFERMFAMARNRGVRTIQMICLKENSRMRHLAVKHDARLYYTQDATEAVLHPCWPTPASMLEEIVGETKGYTHRLFD
jgi:GNAT superfamily N-acetyltransferase